MKKHNQHNLLPTTKQHSLDTHTSKIFSVGLRTRLVCLTTSGEKNVSETESTSTVIWIPKVDPTHFLRHFCEDSDKLPAALYSLHLCPIHSLLFHDEDLDQLLERYSIPISNGRSPLLVYDCFVRCIMVKRYIPSVRL